MVKLAPLAFLQHLAAGVGRKAILRLLLGDMQFQQHVDNAIVLGGLLVDLLQELEAIHRIDHADVGRNVFHLISLQMTDEMPLNVVGQLGHLLAKLLLMALAKNALANGIGRLKILLGVILADGHKADTFGQVANHLL